MYRIVLCSREWGTSTGRYVRSLVEYLQKIDHKNEYFILLQPNDYNEWQPSNRNFKKVLCQYKEFSFQEQLGLKRQIELLQPDLVHFTMVQQPILYRGASITTMHDLTTLRFDNPSKNPIAFSLKQFVYKQVNRIAAHKSKLIIAPTNFVRDDVSSFATIPKSKIKVTYEAADPISGSADSIGSLLDQEFIMYVGRPTPHKNLPRLIEAFKIIKSTHPALRLVLAGKKDALYDAIKQNAEAEGIIDILFTGMITDNTLKWLYQNCRAYVFPSLSEGFGLPGLEAMCHGAPVVSSDASCLPEVYSDAALYFNPLSVADIAEKILAVLDDPRVRGDLIEKGALRYKTFSWEKMARQTLEIYESVLGSE